MRLASLEEFSLPVSLSHWLALPSESIVEFRTKSFVKI